MNISQRYHPRTPSINDWTAEQDILALKNRNRIDTQDQSGVMLYCNSIKALLSAAALLSSDAVARVLMPEGSPIPEHLFVHRTDTPIGHTHHGCKLELGNPHLISQANLSTLITISTTFNSLMFRDGCKAPAHEWVEYDRILDRFKDFGYDFHPHALPKCVMKSASDDSVGKERWHPDYVDKYSNGCAMNLTLSKRRIWKSFYRS
ncbi:hypothetical protein RJ55_06764 [Drechmeria coniospora]|nr:hypothetical protein RJ55_06764 [Drechmeria coniospora]